MLGFRNFGKGYNSLAVKVFRGFGGGHKYVEEPGIDEALQKKNHIIPLNAGQEKDLTISNVIQSIPYV